jgi:hypothetical protein
VGVPLDRVKVGFVASDYRAGPGQFEMAKSLTWAALDWPFPPFNDQAHAPAKLVALCLPSVWKSKARSAVCQYDRASRIPVFARLPRTEGRRRNAPVATLILLRESLRVRVK